MKRILLTLSLGLAFSLNVFSQSEGDIIITEMMIDPNGEESEREWFEVYNTTSTAIDMQNWIIEDISSSSRAHLINTSVVVNPGDYAVFCIESDATLNGGITNVDYAYGFLSSPDMSQTNPDNFPRFNNESSFDDGDTSDNEIDGLVLTLNDGTEIDRVEYNYGYGTPSIPFPMQGQAGGYSVMLSSTAYTAQDNDLASNWSASTVSFGDAGMFGSPGTDENLNIANLAEIELTLYPNPTSEKVYIATDDNIKDIKIYNLKGQLISEIKNVVSKELLVNHLSEGMYFLQISNQNNYTITKKLMIN